MAGLLCGSALEHLCPRVSANHCALPHLPILIIVVVTSVRIVILRIVFVIMLILTIVLFCPQLVKIILTFPDELDKVFFYKVTCNCPINQHLREPFIYVLAEFIR